MLLASCVVFSTLERCPRPLRSKTWNTTCREDLIEIAKSRKADAITPTYGSLSGEANFARAIMTKCLVWVGPSPESIEAFGLKHTAMGLVFKASVPIVPGSGGLIGSEADAVEEGERLGFRSC